MKERRLTSTLEALKEEKIIVVIDETGDRKKGKKTDYVARQYLGSVGKIDNGIVSVNAYGIYENLTFPLIFKIFKPKGRLKENDTYKTKIELASSIVTELIEFGFKFVMTNIQLSRSKMKRILGNLYGLRTWVEYGFRQCKQELGWTDYRFTNFNEINKWWELIFSAYWMISSHSKVFDGLNQNRALSDSNILSKGQKRDNNIKL